MGVIAAVTEAAIEAVTAVDAAALDAAVDDAAVDVPDRAVAQADAIFRHRNTPHRRAISAATIREETIHAAMIRAATTAAAVKVAAATTIAEIVEAIVAVRATTIAGPKAARVRRLRRNRAAKRKFSSRASRSRSIARVLRPLLLQRRSSSTNRTTSRNRISTNPFRAARRHNLPTRRGVLPVCQAGC